MRQVQLNTLSHLFHVTRTPLKLKFNLCSLFAVHFRKGDLGTSKNRGHPRRLEISKIGPKTRRSAQPVEGHIFKITDSISSSIKNRQFLKVFSTLSD